LHLLGSRDAAGVSQQFSLATGCSCSGAFVGVNIREHSTVFDRVAVARHSAAR
jgi:hypothetical protein